MRKCLGIAVAAVFWQGADAANICPVLSSQLLKAPVVASVVSRDCSSFLRASVTPALVTETQTSAVTVTASTNVVPTTVSTDLQSTTVTTITNLDQRTLVSTVARSQTVTVSNVQTSTVVATLPATITQFAKRAPTTPKTLPKYASKLSGLYSKACSCIGVKPCTTTLRALSTTVTKVVTSYAVATAATEVTVTTILPITASTTLTTTVLTASRYVDVIETATVDVTTLLTQTVTVPVSTVRICTAATPSFSAIAKSDDPAFQYNGQYPMHFDPSTGTSYSKLVAWTGNKDDLDYRVFFLNSGMLYERYNFGPSSGALYLDTDGGQAGVLSRQNFEVSGFVKPQCTLSPFDGVRQTLQCSTADGESVFYWCPSAKALCLLKPQDPRAAGCQVITLTALC